MPMGQPTQKIKIDNQGNRFRAKGRRSAPKAEARQTGKKEPYAFIFKDPSLGELPILNTANAWWIDPIKVQKLIDAYKIYATDDQACYYTGITLAQLRYFQELHQDFYLLKHIAKQDPILRAKKKLMSSVEKDDESARWLLSRLEKENFSTRVENTGANGRDLFDNMSENFKKLIEDIRKAKDAENKGENQKYTSDEPAGNIDARQGGDRDETASATPEPSA